MKEKRETCVRKENKKRNSESALYTILDRYLSFCKQANWEAGELDVDERYLERWFVY